MPHIAHFFSSGVFNSPQRWRLAHFRLLKHDNIKLYALAHGKAGSGEFVPQAPYSTLLEILNTRCCSAPSQRLYLHDLKSGLYTSWALVGKHSIAACPKGYASRDNKQSAKFLQLTVAV